MRLPHCGNYPFRHPPFAIRHGGMKSPLPAVNLRRSEEASLQESRAFQQPLLGGSMNSRIACLSLAAGAALGLVSCADMMQSSSGPMSFFISSTGSGNGADLGGLAGADKHCQSLAQAAGADGKTWRA